MENKDLINKTLNLLNKKEENKYSYNDVIGTEIRLKRTDLNLTLKSLTTDTCSVSYLSKIENSKIEANMFVLKELCTKLEISDQQIEKIVESASTANDMLKAFYENDIITLKKLYDSLSDFKNYRALITSSFYLLRADCLRDVERNISSLRKAIEVLNDLDAILFSLLFAEYLFIIKDYLGCYKIIKHLYTDEENYYNLLIQELSCSLSYKVNDDNYLYKLERFKQLNWKLGNIEKLVDLKKYEDSYKFRRNIMFNFNLFIDNPIKNKDRFIKLINLAKSKHKDTCIYNLIEIYLNNPDQFLEEYNKKNFFFEDTHESFLLEYLKLSITNHDKSMIYLQDKCIAYSFKSYDYTYSYIFSKILQYNYSLSTRYKRIVEVESDLVRHFMELNSYYEE
jgi:transcriptional regulator with XRE-family HTH domain